MVAVHTSVKIRFLSNILFCSDMNIWAGAKADY